MYIDNFIYVAHSENKVTKGSIKKKHGQSKQDPEVKILT